MSFVKKYVPKQIQDVFDRIAAKNDRELQSAVSEPRPVTFEVIISASATPDTRSQLIEEDSSGPVNGLAKYRAMSLAGQHDHFIPPETAKTKEDYENLRSMLYQATFKRAEIVNPPQTGQVWQATFLGANLISLDKFVRDSRVATRFSPNTASRAFANAESQANILANYTQDGQPATGVLLKFKSNSVSQDYQDTSKPYYKTFLDKLIAKLRPLGFKADSLVVTSTTRSVEAQVDAMIGTRYATGAQFFVNWFKRNYGDSTERALLPTIEANLSSQSALREAMIKKVREMKNNNHYVSPHMKSGALDIRSNNLVYEDCIIVERALADLKAENLLTHALWEGVAEIEGGKARRKSTGVYDTNEHFHITLVLSAAGE